MTKKQAAAARRAEWNQAIADGRMVRLNGGECFRSYRTAAAAQAIVAAAIEDGLEAEIVDPAKAEGVR
jgi:hypothetical protein